MHKILMPIYRKLFARPRFVNFNKTLFHLSLRGMGVLNYENDELSGETYFIQHLLPRILNTTSPTCFDVGANIGRFSKALHAQFPEATLYAFEPHPTSFKQLSETGIANLHVYQLGLSDSPGTLTLYDRADGEGSEHASLYAEVISDLHREDINSTEVAADTLDAFSKRNKIGAIDYLKIDTEGNELAVLHGARDLIDKGNIKCIQFEFNEMNVISHVFMRDFSKLLKDYELFRLLPKGLFPVNSNTPLLNEIFAFQNIIALPSEIAKPFIRK